MAPKRALQNIFGTQSGGLSLPKRPMLRCPFKRVTDVQDRCGWYQLTRVVTDKGP